MSKNDDFFEKLSKKERARATTATTEEFPQSIQVPSSTQPGTTYPVRAIPHSDNPSLLSPNGGCYIYRSEGFALTGYVVPGCVEDGTWMLWGNSSAAVVVVATKGSATF